VQAFFWAADGIGAGVLLGAEPGVASICVPMSVVMRRWSFVVGLTGWGRWFNHCATLRFPPAG